MRHSTIGRVVLIAVCAGITACANHAVPVDGKEQFTESADAATQHGAAMASESAATSQGTNQTVANRAAASPDGAAGPVNKTAPLPVS